MTEGSGISKVQYALKFKNTPSLLFASAPLNLCYPPPHHCTGGNYVTDWRYVYTEFAHSSKTFKNSTFLILDFKKVFKNNFSAQSLWLFFCAFNSAWSSESNFIICLFTWRYFTKFSFKNLSGKDINKLNFWMYSNATKLLLIVMLCSLFPLHFWPRGKMPLIS